MTKGTNKTGAGGALGNPAAGAILRVPAWLVNLIRDYPKRFRLEMLDDNAGDIRGPMPLSIRQQEMLEGAEVMAHELTAEIQAKKTAILTFDVHHPGERGAGLASYSDVIHIEVESGNVGGEENEFAEFIHAALLEWFDGANVQRRKNE